jgi:hypothetical protein
LIPKPAVYPRGTIKRRWRRVRKRLGFTPRRRWLCNGLRVAVEAFWNAAIEEIYITGSFCSEKPDPDDVDG